MAERPPPAAARGGAAGGRDDSAAAATAQAREDGYVYALATLSGVAALGALFPLRSSAVQTHLPAAARALLVRVEEARRLRTQLESQYGREAVAAAIHRVARRHADALRGGGVVQAETDGDAFFRCSNCAPGSST